METLPVSELCRNSPKSAGFSEAPAAAEQKSLGEIRPAEEEEDGDLAGFSQHQNSKRVFILDRFLPAAQAMAADKPAIKTVRWSTSVPQNMADSCRTRTSTLSPTSARRHESSSSSACGFLTLGFKSALSRSALSRSTEQYPAVSGTASKSNSSRSSSHGPLRHRHDDADSCSSDEYLEQEVEMLIPKAEPSAPAGPWKPKSALVPPPVISYFSTSPSSYRVSSPKYAANFLRDGSPRANYVGSTSPLSSQSTPVNIHSEKLILPHNHKIARPSMFIARQSRNSYTHVPEISQSHLDAKRDSINLDGHNQIKDTSSQDPSSRLNSDNTNCPNGEISNDTIANTSLCNQCIASDSRDAYHHQPAYAKVNVDVITNKDLDCLDASCGNNVTLFPRGSAYVEDDDPQFFDALSRLNSTGSTPGNVTPCTMGSPKSHHEAFAFPSDWTSDEARFLDSSNHFETPRASVCESSSNGSNIRDQKQVSGKTTLSLSQRVGKVLKLQTGGIQDKEPLPTDPLHEYLLRHQPRCESFSGRTRQFVIDHIHDDAHSSNPTPVSPVFPAKCQKSVANDFGWPFGISSCRYPQTEQKTLRPNGQEVRIAHGHVDSKIPAPPLPPSPAGSWLQKAMATQASKPSTLATLQQKQTTQSARKFRDFRFIDTRKEVSWEDMVKGSRIQELHHHHPSNHDILKPLRL